MMPAKIDAGRAAGNAAEPLPESVAGWRNAEARWRRELERAQLAVRASPSGGKGEPTPAFREQPVAAPSPAARASALDSPPRALFNGAPTSTARTDATEKEQPVVAPLKAPARGDVAVPQAAAGEAQAARAATASSPRPSASRAPAFARPQWPAVSVLAAWSGAALKLCIRDASLGEARLHELAVRLRAQLRAAGHRLDTLTVNGHEVISEESRSCQSQR